jgi:fatty-acyl-CoA synthase
LIEPAQSLAGWLGKNAAAFGDRVAIVDDEYGVAWTFGQLHERVRRLSNALIDLGLQPGDRVAMLLRNCYVSAELVYGVSAAGMIVVNVNERLTAPEVAYILRDSGAAAVVLGASAVDLVQEIRSEFPELRHVISVDDAGEDGYEGLLAAASKRALPPPAEHPGDSTAMLIYTSGTTGLPKGVELTQRNLVDSATNYLIESLPINGCYVACVPYFHVGCIVHIAALLRGMTVVVTWFEAGRVMDAIERHRATHIALVPTAIALILDSPDLEDRDLSSLQRIMYAGSPMPEPVLRRGVAAFGPIFEQFYGLTETTGLVTLLRPDDHELDNPARLGSCGREVARVSVAIVRPDGTPAECGEPGEIVVLGSNVTRGYWNRPELVDEMFVDGWFRTGDVGVRDEHGYITIVDRLKDMIITGGTNVYPREVEDALYQHDAVREVAVIGVPDEVWGEVVMAVVVSREPAPHVEELSAWTESRLAKYKRPRRFEFATTLPRNAMGKVDKKLLRQQYSV